ncbi:MAG: response regulator [Thioalkalivibrionaceae bacterium]
MKLLVAEDDPQLRNAIVAALENARYVVDATGDGAQAEFLGSTETYDCAILDLGLPGQDGLRVLDNWRRNGARFPVLILTARDEFSDKLAGFRAGADDYVTKPFRMDEVLLRIGALIRRAQGHIRPVLVLGTLEHDTQTGDFTLNGMPLKLTGFEAQVLAFLMLRAKQLVSRAELAEHLYSYGSETDFNSLEVIISRLRRKIGRDRIETLRGQGYRLINPESATSDGVPTATIEPSAPELEAQPESLTSRPSIGTSTSSR